MTASWSRRTDSRIQTHRRVTLCMQEEHIDQKLLRSAERETRRDSGLVRQAHDEIQEDKHFLDEAYGVKDADADMDIETVQGNKCPLFTCALAKVSGAAPTHCTHSSRECPDLSCYEYTPVSTCLSEAAPPGKSTEVLLRARTLHAHTPIHEDAHARACALASTAQGSQLLPVHTCQHVGVTRRAS